MYAEYFGLKKLPFSITPDPNFVYMSSSHRMAMAQLLYGVQERKPLMVVTGEVGSGKTTMIFTLLSQIDKDAAVSIVFDTQVDPHSLYRYMFADFKISERPADRAEATIILREHLNERMRRNLRTILILDEAHNLSHEILNEVVFLTNMETRQSKLLQIILVGQPELNGILGTQEFRQLRQRISLRTEIKALSYEDTRNYIVHRLREAGSPRPEATFSDEALAQVFRTTIGLPRLINTLCDNAMLTTCARQLKTVEADVIKETARDMEIPSVPKPAPVEHTPAPGAPAHATAP
ncbi:AAA family ATPase, partial [bacterium]|nr:AAA family ATPase [bacterium]